MTRFYWAGSILLVALAAGAAAWLWPTLPDQIPTHWNIRNEVDAYGGKWTLLIGPVMMVGLLVLFYFLPALSPKAFSVDSFRPTYLYIMFLVMGLSAYIQAVLLYTVQQSVTKGHPVPLGTFFIAGMFLFFGLIGNVMGKVRKNFYIGIRVPWTLASDRVWNDTHRMAGWLWVAAGIVGFGLVILGTPIYIPIILLVVAAFIPIFYSFIHYKALERRGAL
jgi:immunity protein, SdpI family